MKKTIQLLMALFAFTYASAQTFIDNVDANNNIQYTVTTGLNVEVTGFQDASIDFVANITIPATVSDGTDTYNVVAVADHAFSTFTDESKGGLSSNANNAGLVTVSLPSSVVSIGIRAFHGQRDLTTINLANVVTIDNNAFQVCDKMTNVDLSSLTTLGAYAFDKCHGFTGEFVAPSLVTIGDGAIYTSQSGGRDSFSSINIPSSVTSIGSLFLGKITSLTDVQVNWADPADVMVNGANFFRDLDIDGGAITLYVPVGTKALYEAAEPWGANSTTAGQYFNHANIVEGSLPTIVSGSTFADGDYNYEVTSLSPREVKVTGTSNAALATIVIPASVTAESNSYSVTAIDAAAFESNTVITSVSLPSSVVSLGATAFKAASSLTTINLENVVTIGDAAFHSCGDLSSTGVLTNATTFEGGYNFYKCSSLTELSAPVATGYGNGFLRESGIVSFSIPSTVTSIGNQLFRKAFSLTTVELNWADPATGVFTDQTNTFGSLTEGNITLYVPSGTVAAYESTAPWNEITNITDASLSAEDIKAGTLDIQVSSDAVTVNSSSTFTNANITIYDITGRVLANQVINGASASVNISNLATGIYIVKVTEGNAKLVKRFAKQ
ncbi:hypothetical protein AXE80_03590 [Wenyingzhuangia fucanilytica]|uniref:Secretion system C-terminal sorting domain-containing protein n=1 Tax=Wenyingzhuangia fucanilytica TaxID=1790137 RepID=A0A1B1Y3U6_9FLAO|nr:leucine-rich repeat protein [Wenyingzhuangia fucanilytica]ANW95417.1 hypothetical protein AXE80_03590 [Wenyingzhuangia fucanilytica]